MSGGVFFQIAVDLFTMSSQFVDLATLSGISKFSGGQIQHFGGYHHVLNTAVAAKFDSALRYENSSNRERKSPQNKAILGAT